MELRDSTPSLKRKLEQPDSLARAIGIVHNLVKELKELEEHNFNDWSQICRSQVFEMVKGINDYTRKETSENADDDGKVTTCFEEIAGILSKLLILSQCCTQLEDRPIYPVLVTNQCQSNPEDNQSYKKALMICSIIALVIAIGALSFWRFHAKKGNPDETIYDEESDQHELEALQRRREELLQKQIHRVP